MQDGTYSVRLILRDREGRTFRESKTFVIASKPPAVRVRLDKSRYRPGTPVHLRVSASETARTIVARMYGAAPAYMRWNPADEIEHGRAVRARVPGGGTVQDSRSRPRISRTTSGPRRCRLKSFLKLCRPLLRSASSPPRGDLATWVQNIEAGTAARSGVLQERHSRDRRACPARRPPAETRPELTKLIGASPSDAELYSLRALEDEQQLDFAAAEADWTKYAQLAAGQVRRPDRARRLLPPPCGAGQGTRRPARRRRSARAAEQRLPPGANFRKTFERITRDRRPSARLRRCPHRASRLDRAVPERTRRVLALRRLRGGTQAVRRCRAGGRNSTPPRSRTTRCSRCERRRRSRPRAAPRKPRWRCTTAASSRSGRRTW